MDLERIFQNTAIFFALLISVFSIISYFIYRTRKKHNSIKRQQGIVHGGHIYIPKKKKPIETNITEHDIIEEIKKNLPQPIEKDRYTILNPPVDSRKRIYE